MPRARSHQAQEAQFHIAIGNLPSRIQRFPPEGDWKAIKDEIRRLRNDEFVQSIRKEEDRIGRDIPQVGEEMEAIDNSIGLDSIPRVVVQQGSAWLEFRSYNDATRLYDILQGHLWEQCVLEVWLLRATAGVNGLLRGPIDNATGFIRPSPVPQSSAIAPMAWSSRSQGTHGSPSRPQPVSSNRRFSTVSNSHISSGQVAQSLVIGRSALLGTPASFRSVYATAGSALQQHYGQNYPNVPLSPGLSSSSSNSSISTLSTTTMINPDIPNHAGNSAFRSTPRVSGTVIACTLPSVPSISTPVSISQGVTQSPTPPSSISGSTSQEPMPALPPLGCYKLTVTNMSLHATKELVGALIEQKTRRYVTLLQPDPIRLRRFNRQLHAYINFTQRDDAEKAEREIRGFSFMGRQLHANLEHVDGH